MKWVTQVTELKVYLDVYIEFVGNDKSLLTKITILSEAQ